MGAIRHQPGYVYLAAIVGSFPLRVKVGMTCGPPSARVQGLSYSHKVHVTLLTYAAVPDGYLYERHAHRRLRKWHVGHEWYEFPSMYLCLKHFKRAIR